MQLARPMRAQPMTPNARNPGEVEMIEQPTSIAWSDDYSDEDEMIDFVVAASEMLEELLARPQPNYLRSRLDTPAQAIARVPGGSLAALRVAP